VTLNILLTFEPPYLIDIVRLHIALTMWASKFHGQCQGSYLTNSLPALSHWQFEPPYLTDSMHINISPTVVTRLLAVWLG